MADLHTTIAGLARARPTLELRTAQICLLVAMRVRTRDEVLAELDEDRLAALYVEVVEVVEGGSRLPRKKATHALESLRRQGLLSRVDGAGLVRAGDYALTRLGVAIADTWLEDEALTRESLVLLTTALRSNVGELLTLAQSSPDAQGWERIRQTLRVNVASLVEGIDRRRRGLDQQQADVQGRVSSLLADGWFDAVEACEALLDDTTTTLGELKDVLMGETSDLLNLLAEIESLATDQAADPAADAAREAQLKVDGIGAWGRARHEAWSEYFAMVQRFLREHVRMDPDRAVSRRLQEGLASWSEEPWFFDVADQRAYLFLRVPAVTGTHDPVRRTAADRERGLDEVDPSSDHADLGERVRRWLADNAPSTLSQALRDLLPEDDGFRVAGRITRHVARLATVSSDKERAWVPIDATMEVEEWTITGGEQP